MSNITVKNIFVSYTSRDLNITPELLLRVDKFLSKLGSVYIDCLHNNATDKQREVIKKLTLSNIIVVVESPFLLKSPWVVLEIWIAILMKKPIHLLPIKNTRYWANRVIASAKPVLHETQKRLRSIP